MQGRFHLYEGHDAARATFAIRVLRALGASRLVVSNAAGGVNPRYQVGDLMVIDDHINFMFRSPLAGLNDPRWGERFVDLSRPYDNQLNNIALDAARRGQFVCHRGVYVGMLGPTYETRAEYRMVRELGGDAVGMSTVPEVIVARQLGMQVFGVSVVTNACSPDKLGETTGEQVVAVAAAAADRMPVLVEAVIKAGAEI
jgi:purine-nucleoside phosphorylase